MRSSHASWHKMKPHAHETTSLRAMPNSETSYVHPGRAVTLRSGHHPTRQWRVPRRGCTFSGRPCDRSMGGGNWSPPIAQAHWRIKRFLGRDAFTHRWRLGKARHALIPRKIGLDARTHNQTPGASAAYVRARTPCGTQGRPLAGMSWV